jgi:hypothetical protein
MNCCKVTIEVKFQRENEETSSYWKEMLQNAKRAKLLKEK